MRLRLHDLEIIGKIRKPPAYDGTADMATTRDVQQPVGNIAIWFVRTFAARYARCEREFMSAHSQQQ